MIRGIQLKDKDQWGKLFIDLKKEIYQLWENNLELSNVPLTFVSEDAFSYAHPANNKPKTIIAIAFFMLHDTSELMQSLCKYKG